MHIDKPIIIALIFFAAVLLAFFLVAPEYNKFILLRSQLAEKKAEYNAKFDYYSEITKNYFDVQSRKEEIQKIDDALPLKNNLGRLVYYIQKTTTDNGLTSKDLFLSKSVAAGGQGDGGVNSMSFTLSLSGNYSALGNFITSLEKSARIFEITKISFGSGSQAGIGSPASQFQSQGSFSFSLDIKTQSY